MTDIEALKKRLKASGAKTYFGAPVCQRCWLPCAGVETAMSIPHYKYGCACVISDWQPTWEEAKEDYKKKMKEIEHDTSRQG